MRNRAAALSILLLLPLGGGAAAEARVLRGLSHTVGRHLSTTAVPVAMATDRVGVVVAGTFHGTVDFDPGPRRRTLTSGHNPNTFVARYSRAGRLHWVRAFHGLSNSPAGVAVDAHGNTVVVGEFYGTATFDGGRRAETLTAPGSSSDGYVAKLDRLGHLLWVRQHGVNGSFAYGVATDSTAAIWVASRANQPTALLRFDADGRRTWSGLIGVRAAAIAVAPDDSVYLTGDFAPLADFDPGPGTFTLPAVGYLDSFVARLSAQGELLWAVPAGGADHDRGISLAVAANGDVTALGRFSGLVDFDPRPTTSAMLDGGHGAMFLWTLSPEGRLVWVRQPPGGGALAMAAGRRGQIVLTGLFSGEIVFESGQVLSAWVNPDAFIVELNPDGTLRWAGQAGGYGRDTGRAVGFIGRDLFVAGTFGSRPADLDPGNGEELVDAQGREEMFLMRLVGGR